MCTRLRTRVPMRTGQRAGPSRAGSRPWAARSSPATSTSSARPSQSSCSSHGAHCRTLQLLRATQRSISLHHGATPRTLRGRRSYLEKLADVWVYPRYLNQASACPHDPLERMKLVVTWFIAGEWRAAALSLCGPAAHKPWRCCWGHASPRAPHLLRRVRTGLHHGFEKWKKPFNPILGERRRQRALRTLRRAGLFASCSQRAERCLVRSCPCRRDVAGRAQRREQHVHGANQPPPTRHGLQPARPRCAASSSAGPSGARNGRLRLASLSSPPDERPGIPTRAQAGATALRASRSPT